MIDPATGWFEMAEIKTKRADVIANVIEQTWFNQYPWPTEVVLDRGTEFMAEFTEMIQRDYGVTKRPITARNPQANGIVERIHQTIGNMLRTFRVHSTELDKEDPWSGILGAVMFATRATIHSTSRATPAQLVFGRDAMLNVQHEANWTYIKERRDKISSKNNKQENKKRRKYEYNVNDKVLLKMPTNLKYGTDAYTGPFKIVQVNDNGTVKIKKGCVTDTYNIRNIKPYYD
jgi:transposase InsO family protein